MRLNDLGGSLAAGLQSQVKARVIIQHGQRRTAPLKSLKVTLEVGLPQCVGLFTFEPLPGLGRFAGLGRDQAVAAQDGGGGAGSHTGPTQMLQTPADLAPAPRGVLGAYRDDGRLYLR